MKKYILFLSIISLLSLSSCIKDEPLYREADIVSFRFEEAGFITSSISNNRIQVTVSENTNFEDLTPIIEVSPGATISPESGKSNDFTENVTYTVTSQDGNYIKTYTVIVSSYTSFKYDFEDWTVGVVNKYPMLVDNSWTSGNIGIALSGGNAGLYPTTPTTDSYKGKYAALLQTLKGKKVILVGYIPLFAGSLYRGTFTIDWNNPAKSTKFGHIHTIENGIPIRFTGYYKYKPGPVFTDRDDNVIEGRVDEFSIYAVIYKVDNEKESLDGTNILTSDKVVGTAILEDRSAKSEYTYFDIAFKYKDEEKLNFNENMYKLAVVFASSKDGDTYQGAVGSKLTVDEVEVVCEKVKK